MQLLPRLGLLLGLLAFTAGFQTHAAETESTAPAKLRLVSLPDCITMALQRNLDVQIVRHSPNIARYNLSAAYGLQYDPVFSFGAKREFANTPPFQQPHKDNPDQPFDVTRDTLDTGLSGKGWPGLSYNLSGSSSELSGGKNKLSASPINNPFDPPNYIIGGLPYWAHASTPYDFFVSQVGLNLKQSLLKDSWIDSGRMQIQITKKDLKISEQAVRLQLMTTVLAVQAAYYDLVFATENVKVMRKALELAEELLLGDRRRIQVGTLQPLAESLAESQVQTANANLLSALQLLDLKRNALRNLLTDDLSTASEQILDPTDGVTAVWNNPSRADSLQTALRLRPDLIEARLFVEKQGIVVKYHQNQMFPTLDLVGSYGAIGIEDNSRASTFGTIGDATYPFFNVGVVLSVPLGNVQARNRYRASQEVKAQTLLNLKKVEQNIFVQVDDSLKSIDNTFKRVAATRKATEYAQTAFKSRRQGDHRQDNN